MMSFKRAVNMTPGEQGLADKETLISPEDPYFQQ
jgi:hypothetical protein